MPIEVLDLFLNTYTFSTEGEKQFTDYGYKCFIIFLHYKVLVHHICLFIFVLLLFMVLRMESSAFCMLSKCSTTGDICRLHFILSTMP